MSVKELKEEINRTKEILSSLRRYLDVEKKLAKVKEFEKVMTHPNFWDDSKTANDIISSLKNIKSTLEPYLELGKQLQDLEDLTGIVEDNDERSIQHLKENILELSLKARNLEFKILLSDEMDRANAILSINAGAGGTEACDWVAMLLRMYSKWAAAKGFKIQQIDFLSGEEAGIKNVMIIIKGDYAYGFLKSETGVHRLVRISPFDANKRRHTSFASVDVIPEVSDEVKVDIKEADLRIDTFRSGGPGGQHMQKSDSAVRVTHIPTGIVVQCQNERSQYKNKVTALKILRARLYEVERKKKEEELAKQYAQKQRIEWGSQIRSYVLHPYSMVKDHRTDFETANADGVLE
ncbi:MAG: peptide chain release factor 2, partial [Candidatus Omnitrophica bacterium]|nr:peptide chain release factor 2 [Candidatus Omnitrophota bacterium]